MLQVLLPTTFTTIVSLFNLELKFDTKIPLIVFSVFLFLYLWCYLAILTTDPGQIPKFYGFWTWTPMSQRKTYCVICKTYKPDRSHHCSTCDVCVLNFDHHCPWINSCIGFWNRKYFILMLIYLIFVIITYLFSFIDWYVQFVVSFFNFFSNFGREIRWESEFKTIMFYILYTLF